MTAGTDVRAFRSTAGSRAEAIVRHLACDAAPPVHDFRAQLDEDLLPREAALRVVPPPSACGLARSRLCTPLWRTNGVDHPDDIELAP